MAMLPNGGSIASAMRAGHRDLAPSLGSGPDGERDRGLERPRRLRYPEWRKIGALQPRAAELFEHPVQRTKGQLRRRGDLDT